MNLIDLIKQNEPALSLVAIEEEKILVMPETKIKGRQFAVWIYDIYGGIMDVEDFINAYDQDWDTIQYVILTPYRFAGLYSEWIQHIKEWVNRL